MEARTYKAPSIQSAISMIKKDLGPEAMILSTRRTPQNARDPYGEDIFEVTAMPGGETAAAPEPARKKSTDDINRGWRLHEENGRNYFESFGALPETSIHVKDLMLLMNREYQLPDVLYRFPEVMQTYARILKSGVSQQKARYFLEQGCRRINGQTPNAKVIAQQMIQAIYESFTVDNPFSQKTGQGPHLSAFIGPTGVGKTTTIAKLAADLNLNKKKRVGLISIDGYRIGALEQLKTYAAIMGLPCLPAFTPADVQSAIHKMRHLDYILIDTAGQSHWDEARMNELNGLVNRNLKPDQKINLTTHIVLSVTTKSTDMADAVSKFGRLNPKTYVFTKMDETRERGGIIDQMLNTRLPVSYITNGQKVPDDIILATRKQIMQLLFQ